MAAFGEVDTRAPLIDPRLAVGLIEAKAMTARLT